MASIGNVNPLIPLSVQVPDISPGLNALERGVVRRRERQERDEREATRQEERAEDLAIDQERFDINLDLKRQQLDETRKNNEQVRLLNNFRLMEAQQQQQLKTAALNSIKQVPFLEANDVEGLRRELETQRQTLQSLGFDTAEVDEDIAMLDAGDIDGLKTQAVQAEKVAEALGLIKARGDISGGSTGILVDRLIDEGSAENVAGALEIIKGGAGAQGRLQAELELKPQVEGAVTEAKEQAKVNAEVSKDLDAQLSQLPRLEEVVDKLSDLGQVATFTKAGRAFDSAKRELGLDVGEGAVARQEYIATVDNEILPLLRQTFGAQFTEREGQALKNTLGNPDLSPREKDALLRAFIDQKRSQIEVLQRRKAGPSEQVIDFNDLPD